MSIGDKVVCVDDGPCKCGGCGGASMGLIKNQVYVVGGLNYQYGKLHLILVGYSAGANASHSRTDTANSNRFRLLDDMKAEARSKSHSTPNPAAVT